LRGVYLFDALFLVRSEFKHLFVPRFRLRIFLCWYILCINTSSKGVGHMQSQIAKWGNSLGIRIPKSITEKVGFTEGTPVILEIVDDTIVIRKKKYDLNTLLSQVTSENLHAEIDTGHPVGREAW
ncbi:MAG: AbrB/MazE/SpoVT family DNA-binding domain-containing protein, partial [Desulfofundulus sp.]